MMASLAVAIDPSLREEQKHSIVGWLDRLSVLGVSIVSSTSQRHSIYISEDAHRRADGLEHESVVVTPEWAKKSAFCQCLLPFKFFIASTQKFFNGLAFHIDDGLSPELRDILSAIIEHRGGVSSFASEAESGIFSHKLVKGGSNSPSSLSSSSSASFANNNTNSLCVSIEWVFDCLSAGKRLEEGPYIVASSHDVSACDPKIAVDKVTYLYNEALIASWTGCQRIRSICMQPQKEGQEFSRAHVFISPLIPNPLADYLAACVVEMGGLVTLLTSMHDLSDTFNSNTLDSALSKGDVLVVCINDSCPLYRLLQGLLSDTNGNSRKNTSNLEIVSIFYLVSCFEEAGKRISLTKCVQSDHSDMDVLAAARSVLYRPLPFHAPSISSMEGLYISISGFKLTESTILEPSRAEVKMLVQLTGACYLSHMCAGVTTHLVCVQPMNTSTTSEKVVRAKAWEATNHSVHIVSLEWLLESIINWRRADEAHYLARDSKSSSNGMKLLGKRHLGPSRLPTYSSSAKEPKASFEAKSPGATRKVYLLSSKVGAAEARDKIMQCSVAGSEHLVSVVLPVVASYDTDCTHLIVDELKRTEKFLCACASGKWILRQDYIDSCFTKSALLPEEDFTFSGNDGPLARAAQRWRNSARRPFQGENVVIVGNTTPPLEMLQRLIITGLGSCKTVEADNLREADAPTILRSATLIVMAPETASTNPHLLESIKNMREEFSSIPISRPAILLDFISENIGESISESLQSHPEYLITSPLH